MDEQGVSIVVCFRGGPSERSFVARARDLDARARAHGGALVAFDATRVAFAFEPDVLEGVLAFVAAQREQTPAGERAFGVGIAEGQLERLADDRGDLASGPALLAAMTLARLAEPGEVLCADSLRALRMGKLATHGARRGRVGETRIRGSRLDLASPWRANAVEHLSTMRMAPLVGVEPLRTDVRAGHVVILRADPGTGGTRFLTELAAASPRALLLSPSGSGFEPLGALRRALARSISRELNPRLLELARELEQLLSGQGVSLEVAARLIIAYFDVGVPLTLPAVALVDDARSVDPSSLEACLLAMRKAPTRIAIVARLDATSGLPPVLTGAATSSEIELPPLTRPHAEALAGGCTNDALNEAARARWARLGANVPLGVVEAIAYGIVTGDIAWRDGKASPRSPASGRGKVRSGAEWALLRGREESPACRTVMGLLALLGGEAKVARLSRILTRAKNPIDVEATIESLMRSRWLVDTQEDWVALPSRTHRETLVTLLDDAEKRALSAAASAVIREEEGVFGQVEAAWHAAQAGEAGKAARILLASAKASGEARLEASTTQLIAFARRTDPTCEDAAMEILADALAKSPSLPPSPASVGAPPSRESMPPLSIDTQHDSEPPTLMRVDLASRPVASPDVFAAPPPSDGATIASRLGDLAKDALLSADNAALERWVDGLRATGESPIFTERMRAMARLGRGDIGDALRVLRRTRSKLEPGDHRRRCQTSLAIGVALSAAGRPQEALLEGMDALARAKQIGDEQGSRACLAFLAKLYSSVQRHDEAEALRNAP